MNVLQILCLFVPQIFFLVSDIDMTNKKNYFRIWFESKKWNGNKIISLYWISRNQSVWFVCLFVLLSSFAIFLPWKSINKTKKSLFFFVSGMIKNKSGPNNLISFSVNLCWWLIDRPKRFRFECQFRKILFLQTLFRLVGGAERIYCPNNIFSND